MLQKLFYTLKGKIITCFVLLIIICVSLSGIISYTYMARQLTNTSIDYSQSLVTKISDALHNTINQLDTLAKVIAINPYALELVKEDASSLDSNNNYLLTKDYIDSITAFNSNIVGVYITDLKSRDYSFGFNTNYLPRYTIENEKWFTPFLKGNQITRLLSPYETRSYTPKDLISFVRKIKVISSKEPIGLIKIDIKASFLEEMSTPNSLSQHDLIILDQNNLPIYSTNTNKNLTPYIEFSLSTNTEVGYAYITTTKEKEIITYLKSPSTGLTVMLTIAEKDLFSSLPSLTLTILGIVVLCILIGLVLALLISNSLSKSLNHLTKGMQAVEHGQLDTVVTITSKDEIGNLTYQFNKMLARINELMKINLEITTKNIKAELKVLQSQINPHFLYNTLESVRMKAIANKPDDVSYIVEELGELLQFTLRNTTDFVTLKTELLYLAKYINLHNIRLRYKINYHFPETPLLEELKIPKFILQPIIENAILHGLECVEERYINIQVLEDEDDIQIIIFNNGSPMPQEQVDLLNDLFDKNVSDYQNHIGVFNVNNRLKLLYGEEYGVFIPYDSSGTTLILSLRKTTSIPLLAE